MMSAMNAYLRDESGAVTVDWVVLTAGIVGLGLATTAVVSGGVEDLSRDVDGQLETNHITTSFGEEFASAWGELDLLNDLGYTAETYEGVVDNLVTSYGGWDEAYTAASTGAMDATNSASYRADAADALGAIEARMVAEGRELPEGQATYQEVHDAWMEDHG